MLAIEKSKRYHGKCTPNILPCRINHNGAVNASKRYWNPTKTPDGKTTAYFRGRKLHGKSIKLPEGYKGIVISSTDRILPRKEEENTTAGEEDEEEREEEEEVKIAEEMAEFDELMLWGHELVLDDSSDPYVRGVEEWIGFSREIHSYEGVEGESKK